MTIQIKGFVASAMYFALGLISYLLIGEYSVFLWSDPWVYVYMAFWPVIWIAAFIFWAIIAAIIIGIIFFASVWWNERHTRKMDRDRRAAKQELKRRTKKP